MRFQKFVLTCAAVGALLLSQEASAQNLIVNAGFENNPPPNFGNNIGYPITPWILGPGNTSNVVTVDGGVSYNYGNGGPRLDADPATPAGVRQHYLDIASGANDFYQSFDVPACGSAPGQVRSATFSGWFSTRDNLSGSGSVSIRTGAGISGPVLAIAYVALPPPAPLTSATAPWVQVTGTVNVTSGSTISYVVSMDNNLNFDQAFLTFDAVTCITSTITLEKAWVSAFVGDTASLSLSRLSVPIETLASTANTPTEVDTDGTPAVGYEGELLTLAEALGPANMGLYNSSLSCTGGGTLSGSTLTVGSAGIPITCRYTNSRVSADVSISKTNGENILVSGSPTSYLITVTNAGPGAADGSVLRDPATSGLTCTSASCAVGSGAAICPPVTVAALQSPAGITIAALPASSALVFTLGCTVD